jgi:hypothetical protein
LLKSRGSYALQAKHADYDADEFNTDVQKFWLQFTVTY